MEENIWIKRLEKLKKREDLEILLIEDPIDLLYLTNLHLSKGLLFIDKENATLFVDGRYFEGTKEKFSDKTILFDEKAIEKFFLEKKYFNFLTFDSKKITYQKYLSYEKLFKKLKEKDKSFSINLKAVCNPLQKMRAIKNRFEIACMKKSAEINWKSFEHLCMSMKEGMTEKDAVFMFERFARENGAEKLAFDPIVSFGINTQHPHYRPSNELLKLNDPVLIDVGVVYENYHSDMTRMFFFGEPDPKIKKMYDLIQKAQTEVLSILKPGVLVKDLDLAARKVLEKEGYESFFTHSLGHGIGLETHEFPIINAKGKEKDVCLEPMMVITIEPGIYLPGFGGVRYENMLCITDNGYENFYD